jgi:hypothetical protein
VLLLSQRQVQQQFSNLLVCRSALVLPAQLRLLKEGLASAGTARNPLDESVDADKSFLLVVAAVADAEAQAYGGHESLHAFICSSDAL